MNHDAATAIALLQDGNARFVAGTPRSRYLPTARVGLVEGQRPWAVVVGCSDSRVPVEAVFDVGPGELFVVRSAGHVISEAGFVSVRYAVEELGTHAVVVLGHEGCGAVMAALSGDAPAWLAPITAHIRVSGCASPVEAVDRHVRESVAEIRSWLAAELPGEQPLVAGAAYQLKSGEVHWL
jgi:carbonic anhydrase